MCLCELAGFSLQIHTKKRNRLEHKRLNKLVYVSYNRKMTNRFLKLRELGSKGKRHNPLVLDEFHWDNEWVDANCEPVHQGAASDTDVADLNWNHVDEAMAATEGLRGRNLPRAAAHASMSTTKSYFRKRKHSTTSTTTTAIEEIAEDDDDIEDEDYTGVLQPEEESESESMDEDEDEDGGGGTSARSGNNGGFQVDESLL